MEKGNAAEIYAQLMSAKTKVQLFRFMSFGNSVSFYEDPILLLEKTALKLLVEILELILKFVYVI